MKYLFHFHDRPDSDHVEDLETPDQARALALKCLLDVARDEAATVPFQLKLSVTDENQTTICRLNLKIDPNGSAGN